MAVLRAILLSMALSASLLVPVAHADDEDLWQENVRLTFYTLRGTMRWGSYTYLGAAACGSYFPAGTRLKFRDGFTVTCEDTGLLSRYQVDVWAPSYAWGRTNIADPDTGGYGDYAWVTVVRWGW